MKTLIIEDETAAAVNLRALLSEVDPSIEIIEVLESIGESVDYLQSNPMPELIFMDIHLADGESFRIFNHVDITCPIIFTTAYDQYALEAFKVNSIDYLLKPIAPNDLHRAMDKLHRLSAPERSSLIERTNAMAHTEQQQARENIFLVQVRDRIRPLNAEEVAFFYTSEERVTAHTFTGEVLTIDRTLEALSNSLPEADFYRANRQFIISRKALNDISVWFGSRLALNLSVSTPERIVISKARVPKFKKWLTGGE
ncbi:MAG: response regulator transcription factor [Rikenellaceae bacterium]|jgi:two-component system LytT family response regulator|nr:response regulator transcription factor [Rikenellaceae bacterium]